MNTQMFFAVNSKGMSHKSQKLRTHEVDDDDDELEDELDDSEIDEDDDEFLDNEEEDDEDEEELSAFRQKLMRLERKQLKRQPPLEIMDMTFAKPVKTPQKRMSVNRHDDGKTLSNPAWEF